MLIEKSWVSKEVDLIVRRLERQPHGYFYIPILRGMKPEYSIPDALNPSGRLYKDFRNNNEYPECLRQLLEEKLLLPDVFKLPVRSSVPYKINLDSAPRFFSNTQRVNCNGGVFPKSLNNTQTKIFVKCKRENGISYLQSIFENFFSPSQQNSSSMCVALCALDGMGGVGKTTLAAEYSWAFSHYYSEVFWIDASSKNAQRQAYQALLKKMSGVESNDTLKELIPQVTDHLSQRSHFLIVCDNVERRENVEQLGLESLPTGHILCTSRHNDWYNSINIGLLSEKESLELFYNRSLRSRKAEDEVIVKQLVNERLCNLALAITQAASYIRQSDIKKRSISFVKYLQDFENTQARSQLLKYAVPTTETNNGGDVKNRAVLTTWQMTMDSLDEQIRDDANRLMFYFSYFEPTDIPLVVVYENRKEEIERAIDELVSYSMINRSDADHVSIHRIVQYATQHNAKEDIAKALKKLGKMLLRFQEDEQYEQSERHENRQSSELKKGIDRLSWIRRNSIIISEIYNAHVPQEKSEPRTEKEYQQLESLNIYSTASKKAFFVKQTIFDIIKDGIDMEMPESLWMIRDLQKDVIPESLRTLNKNSVKILINDCSLHKLNFTGIEIDDSWGEEFAAMLKNNDVFDALILNKCKIGDQTLKYITDAIKYNMKIERIELSSNNITEIGALYLLNGLLEYNSSIRVLNLNANKISQKEQKSLYDLKSRLNISQFWCANQFDELAL